MESPSEHRSRQDFRSHLLLSPAPPRPTKRTLRGVGRGPGVVEVRTWPSLHSTPRRSRKYSTYVVVHAVRSSRLPASPANPIFGKRKQVVGLVKTHDSIGSDGNEVRTGKLSTRPLPRRSTQYIVGPAFSSIPISPWHRTLGSPTAKGILRLLWSWRCGAMLARVWGSRSPVLLYICRYAAECVH